MTLVRKSFTKKQQPQQTPSPPEQARRDSTLLEAMESTSFSVSTARGLESVAPLEGESTYGGGASLAASSWVNSQHPGGNASSSQHVADKEQRIIGRTKWVLLFAYIASLVTLTVSTYRYVKNQEQDNFRNEFEIFAEDAIALTGQNVRNAFDAMELFSTSISSYVANSNMTWPQVVIPNFSAQAQRFAKIGGANLVTFGVIVEEDERLDFEAWSRNNVHAQIQEDIDYLRLNATATELEGIPAVISALNISSGTKVPETRSGPYLVNWQRYPFETPKHRIFVNNNLLALQTNRNAYATTQITRQASLSFAKVIIGIRGQIFQPIFDQVEQGRIVGVLWVTSFWARYFKNLLPDSAVGVVAVLRSSCGFQATFEINGRDVVQLGLDDLHDTTYDNMEVSGELFTFSESEDATRDLPDSVCLDKLTLHVYPSEVFEDSYLTSAPFLYSGLVLVIFIVAMVLFVIYDVAVNRRQIKVMLRLNKQHRIVSDLFPELIMTRLYEGYDQGLHDDSNSNLDGSSVGTPSDKKNRTTKTNKTNNSSAQEVSAIADLYPEATILQADVVGFTAWSSQRAPSQVFTLLESLFVELDKMTRQFNVFKVESIGDCYIAVTGVPDADPRHAINMARFARHCLAKSTVLMRKLEVKLGPDTGGLQLRIGMHSGQVTAGVLRGDRARFQLFGDSVNTAGLLLKNCKANRIHLSESTANLLQEAKKGYWVQKRSETITLSGKGTMQTFWLRPRAVPGTKVESSHKPTRSPTTDATEMNQIEEGDEDFECTGDRNQLADPCADGDASSTEDFYDDVLFNEDGKNSESLSKRERLVEWHVEVLSELLEQVLAARAANPTNNPQSLRSLFAIEASFGRTGTVLEEFQEIITLPKTTEEDIVRRQQQKSSGIHQLPTRAKEQLRNFLTVVSELYQANNAFHNFEHASHVTASVSKMLARITDTHQSAKKALSRGSQTGAVTNDAECRDAKSSTTTTSMTIQDLAGHSYGITSDPLTQFAVVFSAIVHDADHPGVTNAQLIQEKSFLAARYKEKSVAEQNSVDLVWELLISPEYTDLRQCIYTTEDELRRFRQLIVNIVMATDICDKELGALRKNRWNLAFSEQASQLVSPEDDVDRKATIVLEHLIQASDVCHTMQHWDVYLLWNERFFDECYGAYRSGRAATDPSSGWYRGEIGFFDFYIIPLAKKLKSCGVFGVSSDEYLDYALANRKMWEENGKTIVDGYMKRFEESFSSLPSTTALSLSSHEDAEEPTATGDAAGVV